jgi:protein-tyrosine phosphatase
MSLSQQVDADRVAAGLFVGSAPDPGHYRWIHVLVLCAQEYQPPREAYPGVAVVRVPLDDDPSRKMTKREISRAVSGGRTVARYLGSGHRVLVTCAQGWNRSGLVAGIAMLERWNMDPDEVVGRVRAARGDYALSNPRFVELIEKY